MRQKEASEKREPLGSLRWIELTLSIVLALVGALCLLKYLGWAWVVSGAYGLPSQAEKLAVAQRRSLTYLGAGLLAEVALIASLTANLRLGNSALTGAPKAVARILGAFAIAIVGTLVMALLLTWIGRMLR